MNGHSVDGECQSKIERWVPGAGCWVLGAGCWVLLPRQVPRGCAQSSPPIRSSHPLVPLNGCVVHRYQDLVCWQLADELKREVYKRSPSAKSDFDFTRQLRRSASSGPANLSEGFAYYRHKESAKHARIAKGSLTETQNHIGDGIDRRYWTVERCAAARQLADRAIGATTEWIRYLMSSEDPPDPQR